MEVEALSLAMQPVYTPSGERESLSELIITGTGQSFADASPYDTYYDVGMLCSAEAASWLGDLGEGGEK
jgi:hypothetical protein